MTFYTTKVCNISGILDEGHGFYMAASINRGPYCGVLGSGSG